MDPWRLATRAQRRINALAGTALASCVLAWLAGFGSASHVGASIENTSAAAIESTSAKSIVEFRQPVHHKRRATEPPQKIVWQAPTSVTSLCAGPPIRDGKSRRSDGEPSL